MQRFVLLVSLVGGCVSAPSVLEMGSGSDSTAGAGTGMDTATDGSTSAESTASPDGSTSAGGSSTTASTDPGSTGEPVLLGSCAEILMLDPAAPTGYHSIARARDGAEIKVYCEMELDGGGWTLIGRSEPGGSPMALGWGQSQGTLGDGQAPYSLNVVDVGLPFMEILISRRTGFATPTGNAYVVEVPAGFVDDYAGQALEHMSTRTVLGGCDPVPPPSMLSWVGHTDNDQGFFIRDNGGDDPWGLSSLGFRLAYDDCARGADLDGEQGALFVR